LGISDALEHCGICGFTPTFLNPLEIMTKCEDAEEKT